MKELSDLLRDGLESAFGDTVEVEEEDWDGLPELVSPEESDTEEDRDVQQA
jgi:hypothetical protein